MTIATTNPATGQVEKTFEPAWAQEVERRLELAASTFVTYRDTDFRTRARWMNAAAAILDRECDAIATVMTQAQGTAASCPRPAYGCFATSNQCGSAPGTTTSAPAPRAANN